MTISLSSIEISFKSSFIYKDAFLTMHIYNSIFKKENLVIHGHFSDLPPEVILEIDVHADTEKTTEMDYVLEKIQDYLDFGVKKVIWIFTKNRKVMVATKEEPWLTHSWSMDIEVWEEVKLSLQELVAQFQNK